MILQVNVKKIAKLIAAKKWSAAGELLSESTFPLQVLFCESDLLGSFTGVRWIVRAKESCEFVFDKSMPKDRSQFFVTRLVLLLPLIKTFHNSHLFHEGQVFINLDDSADAPGLAFCSNRSDSILIPDTDFLNSYGYRQSSIDFAIDPPSWEERLPIVFWRGTTTGVRTAMSWHSLPRLKLCELSNQVKYESLFDVGVSSLAQTSKQEEKEIKAAGYMRNFVPLSSCNQYKYQIDIDGNTNAWSALFNKLLSGSVVLKVASPHHFRQWYYDELVPWVNYVPIKSDMSDLIEKIRWLIEHDDKAKEIGVNGQKLALRLTYDEELNKALISINKALK
jgi:hypothetical protein